MTHNTIVPTPPLKQMQFHWCPGTLETKSMDPEHCKFPTSPPLHHIWDYVSELEIRSVNIHLHGSQQPEVTTALYARNETIRESRLQLLLLCCCQVSCGEKAMIAIQVKWSWFLQKAFWTEVLHKTNIQIKIGRKEENQNIPGWKHVGVRQTEERQQDQNDLIYVN